MFSIAPTPILKVAACDTFATGQRVLGTDVEAWPPQLHAGTISSVWSDGSAIVKWDHGFTLEADSHLVENGRIDLHHLRRLS